jgi:hypothetical protein
VLDIAVAEIRLQRPHKERPHMPGSQTALGRVGARNSTPLRLAFRQQNGVSAQNDVNFAAQWLAYAIPCRRFPGILADACARPGADVVCYSFIVVDFHHLLLADLPAHTAFDPMPPKSKVNTLLYPIGAQGRLRNLNDSSGILKSRG